jgi:hypothetical protein
VERPGELVSRAAAGLGLAATPTFAMMALLTGVLGGGGMAAMCGTTSAAALGGMVPMYLLMSAFHSPAWLRLIARRRSRDRTTRPLPLG